MSDKTGAKGFYDPDDFPAFLALREQWETIRDELRRNAARVVEIPCLQ